jgi:hypothetical protein
MNNVFYVNFTSYNSGRLLRTLHSIKYLKSSSVAENYQFVIKDSAS